MEQILIPSQVRIEEVGEHKARLTVEPCYPGYGTTLGNSLRRVLLSSVPGAAITAVKIAGVDHEFSTVPGVAEDVVEMILNLKGVRLKCFSAEPVKVVLKAKGEGKVTAGDIEANAEVEVVNKDHFIAKLTDAKATLELELTVAQGRGYLPVEMRDKDNPEIGVMQVDAIYTPVRNCGFAVENVRVGQMTNYDKLTLDVETDGTISPKEALAYATGVLMDHFKVLNEATK